MTDTFLPSTPGAGPSRRTVLRAVSVSGAAAVLLAACGGGDPATSGNRDATTPSDGASPSAGEGSGAARRTLVATADVPVGSGVILEAEKVVVTQPIAGEFKGFSATCTHQQCPVSRVERKSIICDCHFSAFKITDGSPTTNPEKGKPGPATRALTEIPVTVEGDQVVQT